MSSSSFTDSFDQIAGDSPAASTGPFDFAGDDSHQLNSSSFAYSDSPIFTPLQPIHVSADGRLGSSHPTDFTSLEPNYKPVDASDFGSDGSILPPPDQMQSEEGFALREWRRLNSIRLEEKEKMEKELLSQIANEADEYKVKFHMRRKVTCETNKAANREKEKSFMASQEKFYTEVEKNYWKAIAELIPNEVPVIEKRGKKDQDKKPSVVVIQGPKPGKPTDMSRMRQLLLKLKHNAPTHLMPSPPPAPTLSKDTRTGDAPAVVTGPEAIAVV